MRPSIHRFFHLPPFHRATPLYRSYTRLYNGCRILSPAVLEAT
ncbi:hypothetical protein HMPREF9374_3189 [Desmospora sp. 8437]|nr:hypothetical protein HMPREF9374_3189 [Desmospora sp. 8437]